jgi:ubiquinol-cytochrome c reductase iron-sulfur subunit
MRVTAFLALTVLGALGATLAAALGSPPAILAGSLAVAFAGLAGAAAAAAVGLRARDDLTEPREPRGPTLPSPLPEDGGMSRRVFGKMWFAALGAFAVLGLVPLVSLARRPGRRELTGWRAGLRLVDENNRPIARDRLADGGIATVFPQDGVGLPDASAVLIRVPPELLHSAGRNGAAVDGYVAFSKVCTHAGCPVALYRHRSHELYCPCHQSRFDVLRGAKNVAGPAPRPLPALALDVDAQGYLVARGDFDAPVGPDDWDRVR